MRIESQRFQKPLLHGLQCFAIEAVVHREEVLAKSCDFIADLLAANTLGKQGREGLGIRLVRAQANHLRYTQPQT